MSCSGLERIEVFEEPLIDERRRRARRGQILGDPLGVAPHPLEVFARLRVAGIGHLGQGEDRHVLGGGQLLGAERDELLQFGGVDFQLVLGVGHLPLGVPQAELHADLGPQLLVVEGLDDVVVGLGLVALDALGGRALAGNEDDLHELADGAGLDPPAGSRSRRCRAS